jgi:lysophospholipid acyltransferase (LPLAT)-like uncharacterized protein
VRRAIGVLLGLVARLWLGSLRLTLVVAPELSASAERSWVLAFWHGHQFTLLRWPRRRRLVALVSLSRDGELQAGALPRLGIAVERGSSSRGGASGLKALVRRIRAGLDAAIAVDGPRGPRGLVRSDGGGVGAALAARLGGGVVVPMAAVCSKAWIFSRSWDRFELPRPFSRVAVALGRPIEPDDADPAALGEAIESARATALAALGRAGEASGA